MQQASKFVVKNNVKSMMLNVFMAHDGWRRALLFFMLQFIVPFNVISLLRYVFWIIKNMQGQPLVLLWYFGRPGLKSVAALPVKI